ncbi:MULTISPECIES: methyltransferase [unclassified Streptomyces]|uniref:methyltransferase n=1 Tax=unclassified Streptomyces TaxID=2593676 RepID=UPI003804EE1F
MHDSRPDTAERYNHELRQKIMGYIVSQAIHAICELGIPDLLARRPHRIDELAAGTGADPDALHRFLRVLAAEGILTEEQPGTFALTDMGSLLRTDVPGSLAHLSSLMAGEAYRAWGAATHSLRTGSPGFEHVYGSPYFEWLAHNPEAARTFNEGQAGLVALRLLPLLEWDWSEVGTVVDVGGGNGALLSDLLRGNDRLKGVILDLPHVLEETRRVLADAGLDGRADCVGGSFFDRVPSGGDVYVLAQILHDWDDEQAVRILASCRRAMGEHGRLLILEQVVPDDGSRHPAALLDLHMLVLLGGRERTESQWRALLDRGGFDTSAITRGARAALIEAAPRKAPA